MVTQENILKEKLTFDHILDVTDKLSLLSEDILHQLQMYSEINIQIDGISQILNKGVLNTKEHADLLSKKLDNLENLLIPVAAVFQSKFPDTHFWEKKINEISDINSRSYSKLIHYCQTIVSSLGSFSSSDFKDALIRNNQLLERQQDLLEAELKSRKKESYAFWLFVLVFFTAFFIWYIRKH